MLSRAVSRQTMPRRAAPSRATPALPCLPIFPDVTLSGDHARCASRRQMGMANLAAECKRKGHRFLMASRVLVRRAELPMEPVRRGDLASEPVSRFGVARLPVMMPGGFGTGMPPVMP